MGKLCGIRGLRSFTLIELLVVVAIIAVLVAILLPALSKARESARMITCQSNMRMIGQAVVQYCFDNNGKFMYWLPGRWIDNSDPPASWYKYTYRYLLVKYLFSKNLPMGEVPDDFSYIGPWLCPTHRAEDPQTVHSYGYNYIYLGQRQSPRYSNIEFPDKLIVFGESYARVDWGYHNAMWIKRTWKHETGYAWAGLADRHWPDNEQYPYWDGRRGGDGLVNLIHSDGHVDALRRGFVIDEAPVAYFGYDENGPDFIP